MINRHDRILPYGLGLGVWKGAGGKVRVRIRVCFFISTIVKLSKYSVHFFRLMYKVLGNLRDSNSHVYRNALSA